MKRVRHYELEIGEHIGTRYFREKKESGIGRLEQLGSLRGSVPKARFGSAGISEKSEPEAGQPGLESRRSDAHGAISVALTSWHQVWDLAYEHLSDAVRPLETIVRDAENHHVIASFTQTDPGFESSSDDTETELDEDVVAPGPRPRWECENIYAEGDREFFFNRNVADYHWQLLDGARHEVPFRLSFLESLLERYPYGPVGYCLDLVCEIRDRVMPKAMH